MLFKEIIAVCNENNTKPVIQNAEFLTVKTASFKGLSKPQSKKSKVKLSRYTPWRHMGGEEV
jgi:hypothetical protein